MAALLVWESLARLHRIGLKWTKQRYSVYNAKDIRVILFICVWFWFCKIEWFLSCLWDNAFYDLILLCMLADWSRGHVEWNILCWLQQCSFWTSKEHDWSWKIQYHEGRMANREKGTWSDWRTSRRLIEFHCSWTDRPFWPLMTTTSSKFQVKSGIIGKSPKKCCCFLQIQTGLEWAEFKMGCKGKIRKVGKP